MIAGQPKTGTLANSIMSARCFEPFAVTTRDGRPARIAIIDDQGNIIDAGDAVAKEAWNLIGAQGIEQAILWAKYSPGQYKPGMDDLFEIGCGSPFGCGL